MIFFPRGRQNLVKIGQITKILVIFVYFFNLDPFSPFSTPLEYFKNPYGEYLYCFLKRTLETAIYNRYLWRSQQLVFNLNPLLLSKQWLKKIEIIKVKTSNSICIIMHSPPM